MDERERVRVGPGNAFPVKEMSRLVFLEERAVRTI